MTKWSLLILALLTIVCYGQTPLSKIVYSITEDDSLTGTLLLPAASIDTSQTVVVIIPGSGPTDRDGNNAIMKNNAYKLLAENLANYKIASLRYDKRGIGQSASAFIEEEKLTFQNNVDDAKSWINFLTKKGYSKIVIIGHSEGSLVGLLLSRQDNRITKYISIAGAGRMIQDVLKEQYKSTAPVVRDSAHSVIDSLVKSVQLDVVSPWLFSTFRPSIQPYMISWMQINPQEEIAQLGIPTLLLQGSTDIQVKIKDIQLLGEAKPDAVLTIIEGMNHVLKEAPLDRSENVATYDDPSLPLHPELMLAIVQFIRNK